MVHELARHAPTARPRRRVQRDQPRGLPHLYAERKRRPLPDLYVADRAEARRGGGFRWFFSTCLAAGVGAIAIAAVIFGSMDARDGSVGSVARTPRLMPPAPKAPVPQDGLKWATPKSDRLQTAAGAMSTKYVVQESVNQRRGNREYIHNKFYARIAVRLSAVTVDDANAIPAFNPFKLYGSSGAGESSEAEMAGKPDNSDIAVRVVDLLGSILPTEDGQELDNQEVMDLVNRSAGQDEAAGFRPSFVPDGADVSQPRASTAGRMRGFSEPVAPNTTVLEKSGVEQDEVVEEADGQQVKVRLTKGESLSDMLQRMGADAWQVREMMEKVRNVLPESAITPRHEIELTMVPSLTKANKIEPMRLVVRAEDGSHKLSVGRNSAGEFIASATPLATPAARPAAEGERQATASLYASLYHAALAQGISPDTILQILRVHAYEIDFRRRARGSDGVDLFFDLRDDGKAADNPPADLLSTAITVGGETQRYYRFRTPDGLVDYYDENGNNSRKFLMRRPIRSEEVRFVSGYGLRRHPLIGQVRMHTGVDWAGPQGTPILAAGNGVIEEVGFKGNNGNYVRIRHANGYHTAYSHMLSRVPPDIRNGAKVRQGQVIGYLGNTGLSTGAHLHFEVLISSRFVDPMSIQVPKERKLTGKQLADFQRERARIEDLMRRPPVRVAQLEGKEH